MTWDVYALRAPRGARSVEQIPDGYTGPALGDPDDVVATIRTVVPDLDTSDPRWLRVTGADHAIEIALGKGIRVHDVSFYITGDESAVPVVMAVCRALGITPFDTDTGDVLTSESRPPADAPVEPDEDRPWWRRLLGR